LVRRVALRINQDIATSYEVTEQYVDLESRLRNLEATSARLRDFLQRAQTITETLTVNEQLTRVEQEIEQIKGKLNALNARSAFSTITTDLQEPLPTPAPTHTPTITPSPTPTATPTPNVWRPNETLDSAVTLQTNLLQGLGTLAIWLIVVLLPYLLALGLVALGIRWLVQKMRRKSMP
jgi:TolA-binding protein